MTIAIFVRKCHVAVHCPYSTLAASSMLRSVRLTSNNLTLQLQHIKKQ